ncbi:hypothetical protein SPFL3102_02665 [Sporomusaceae bacterium FL31]|nr:hypothetical protein SPFL3101_02640 [Sporomusaceae bacterium FL31]GCE34838.1 hypothetical protein SPFL3102_02665 [Sporomusaceae bacterium]
MQEAIVKQIVILTDRVNSGKRLLKVDCPYCGKTHTHGGGMVTDDIYEFGGSRSSHCCKDTPNSQYCLVIPSEVPIIYFNSRNGKKQIRGAGGMSVE